MCDKKNSDMLTFCYSIDLKMLKLLYFFTAFKTNEQKTKQILLFLIKKKRAFQKEWEKRSPFHQKNVIA